MSATGSDASARPGLLRRFGPLLAVLAAIQVAVLVAGARAAATTPLDRARYRDNYHHHRLIGRYERPPRADFFELWVAADAQWYLAIAADGYPRPAEVAPPSPRPPPIRMIAETDTLLKYAWFPLWPWTLRLAALPGLRLEAAGFLAANALALAAMLLLFTLLERRHDHRTAFWSVVLLFASPFALFLRMPFSESLFLLLGIVTCLLVERRRWALAALAIGLAMITRATGLAYAVVPVVALAQEAWNRRRAPGNTESAGGPGGTPAWRALLPLAWLALAALPPLLWMALMHQRTGDALFFNQVTKGWGAAQGLGSPWHHLVANTWGTLRDFADLPWHEYHRSKLDFLVLVACLVTLVAGARVLPLPWLALAAALIAIPLLTKDLMSFTRYSLVGWPLFCVPVLLLRPERRALALSALAVAFTIAQMANAAAIVNWEWVG